MAAFLPSHRFLAAAALAAVALTALGVWGLPALDRAFPPPLGEIGNVSTEVVDRDGRLLRAFATPEGRWRLAASLDAVDPKLVDMLIGYEDRRFYAHRGIDFRALLRAAAQFAANGRIVSGGSTLSMQLARLIEPRSERSLGAKLKQILRAVQIERRLAKPEILAAYLTLAPYGGNLEGVRAASLAWFGKEPKRLSTAEAALLVALPQSPEARRPDRHPEAAQAARRRVVERLGKAGMLAPRDVALALAAPLPATRRELPTLAAHAAAEALRRTPAARRIALTLSRGVQEGLEAVALDTARRLGPKLSVAMVMADAATGDVLGRIGSADFLDPSRSGWVDMTRARRSPGSTLKPFIYALAFEQGMVAQETMIEDRTADFGGYRPRNFDMAYQGDVTVRQALQLSLNVPAIRLLDAVGPLRLTARFRSAEVRPALPAGEAPGLAIGLGGVGMSLSDLVQLYTAFPNRGRACPLREAAESEAGPCPAVLEPAATWQVADILSGVLPPSGAPRLGIAYKTGTSYGYRDAWSIGFDGRHVLGVWVGRADGGPVPGLTGYTSAAPALFGGFARSGLALIPLARAPAGALRQARDELPVTLRAFVAPGDLPKAGDVPEPAPRIVYPPDGARIELGRAAGEEAAPLVLKLQGGRAPFRWLANGKPVTELARTRTSRWAPDGEGFSTLTVIDAAGRAASVSVYLQ